MDTANRIPDIERALRALGDLLAADADLRAAAAWVRTQDPSPAVATAVEKVVAYVRGARG
jgi:hypothetical protein